MLVLQHICHQEIEIGTVLLEFSSSTAAATKKKKNTEVSAVIQCTKLVQVIITHKLRRMIPHNEKTCIFLWHFWGRLEIFFLLNQIPFHILFQTIEIPKWRTDRLADTYSRYIYSMYLLEIHDNTESTV